MPLFHKISRRFVYLCALSASLLGCSSADFSSYAGNAPKLLLEEFFNGQLSAHGIVKNRSGEVIRYFNASLQAVWDENGRGTLDEYFVFDDGEQQRRVWTLQRQPDGGYLASANDVPEAVPMHIAGNALFMDYHLQLQYRGRPLELLVEDKMYLVNANTIVNESVMRKFGLQVGSVSLVIQKRP